MPRPVILASGSPIRLSILRNAGVDVVAKPARVDEDSFRRSLLAEGARPRDLSDALAEMKAARVADKESGALVLGCDQVLEFDGEAWSKPQDAAEARAQLMRLRGKSHRLWSALVLYDAGQPIWRHIGEAKLTVREFSEDWLDAYLNRNWPRISGCVGGYMLESEGIMLFSAIEGDYFTILGLPILPLLSYLGQRGFIAT